MESYRLIFWVALFVAYGIIDYHTEVIDKIPRFIRKIYWGPVFILASTLMCLYTLHFNPNLNFKWVLFYGLLILGISVVSLYCGRWAMEFYARKLVQKSVIITIIHYLIVSFFAFFFIHFAYDPYSVKIAIPAVPLLLWAFYHIKRELDLWKSEAGPVLPISPLKLEEMKRNSESTLVEVFSGTIWEAELVKSMIEDAKIQTYIKNEIMGTLNPWWVAPGGAGSVTVVVSSLDYEEAKKVVIDYEKNISQE